VGVCWFSGKKAGPKCGHVVKELAGGDREIPECELAHNDDTYPLSGGYAQWFHDRSGEQGRGRFALGTDAAAPTLGSGSRRSAPVEILTPHNHDRPARSADSRGILLRASAEPLVPYLTWFVDGIEIGRTEPPYELRWEPTRGEHTIMAVTPRNRAAVVSVFVE
jgi:hypothetical protein